MQDGHAKEKAQPWIVTRPVSGAKSKRRARRATDRLLGGVTAYRLFGGRVEILCSFYYFPSLHAFGKGRVGGWALSARAALFSAEYARGGDGTNGDSLTWLEGEGGGGGLSTQVCVCIE